MKYITSDPLKAQEYYFKNNGIIEYNDFKYSIKKCENNCNNGVLINCIEDLGYIDDWVYDVETVEGNFNSGVGSLILKNTDSVFLNYIDGKDLDFKNKEDVDNTLKYCYEKGNEMAAKATELFRKPILLEFEKVYLPIIMLGKKTYVGNMFEPPDTNKSKMDKKGIVLKRRDNANITKIIYGGILDILFAEGKKGTKKSIQFLSSEIDKILNYQTDYKDLVISKTYKSNYKNQNIPHKVLAEKMKERDPGSAPNNNDRVPYVFIENNFKNQYEKVEDPSYAIEHNLKIDALYYIRQIRNPITQLLSTFLDRKEIDNIFDSHCKDYELKKKGQRKITNFFKKK